MQQRLPSRFERPILFAHRGAKAHSAENTLESFELAVRPGATGLETDVWLSKDGEVVCDHDGVVNKRLRRISINRFNRHDLSSSIPSLEEVFERCGRDINYSKLICLDDWRKNDCNIAVVDHYSIYYNIVTMLMMV